MKLTIAVGLAVVPNVLAVPLAKPHEHKYHHLPHAARNLSSWHNFAFRNTTGAPSGGLTQLDVNIGGSVFEHIPFEHTTSTSLPATTSRAVSSSFPISSLALSSVAVSATPTSSPSTPGSLSSTTSAPFVAVTGKPATDDVADKISSSNNVAAYNAGVPNTQVNRGSQNSNLKNTITVPSTTKVKPGDTFNRIASQNHLSPKELAGLNPQIANPDVIHVGQVLKLSGQSQIHKVQPHENLFTIARDAHISLASLQAANPGFENIFALVPGATLVIPATPTADANQAGKNGSGKEGNAVPVKVTEQPASTRYSVKAGDYLYKIATDHGVSLAALEAANPKIKNARQLQIGQTILIPTKSQVEAPKSHRLRHVVKDGETLYEIAQTAGVTLAKLKAANPGIENMIKPGQDVVVPYM